jgi:hypothetical protein
MLHDTRGVRKGGRFRLFGCFAPLAERMHCARNPRLDVERYDAIHKPHGATHCEEKIDFSY